MFDYAVANYDHELLAITEALASNLQDSTNTTCRVCIEGFYSDQADSEMCKACSVGFFSGATESKSCTRCGSGTYAPEAAAECSSCVGPYYDLDQTASTPCAPCPGESPAFCKCSSTTQTNHTRPKLTFNTNIFFLVFAANIPFLHSTSCEVPRASVLVV